MPKQTAENLDTLWQKIEQEHPEANFLQSPAWGRMNELIGHKVVTEHLGTTAWAEMIVKNARRGRYLEIPCGPLVDWRDPTIVRQLLASIRNTAEQEKCVFVRIRPQLPMTPENVELLESYGFRKAPMHLAAEHTVLLDLTKPAEDLLKEMRRQTRYEVRRAIKLGIKVSSDNSEELFKEFHEVQSETAARQHFVPPDLKTLLAEREAFGDHAKIYVAKTGQDDSEHNIKQGQPIAYGLIISAGNEAAYYEAASTELNQHLPGAYALQWQIIQDLQKAGIKRYNLWGIAPPGETKHRYSGVTTFKTGFGGNVVEFVPAADLVISRLRYSADWLVETVRKKRRHL